SPRRSRPLRRRSAREPFGELITLLARRIVRSRRHRVVAGGGANEDAIAVQLHLLNGVEDELTRRALTVDRRRRVAALTPLVHEPLTEVRVRERRSARRTWVLVDGLVRTRGERAEQRERGEKRSRSHGQNNRKWPERLSPPTT